MVKNIRRIVLTGGPAAGKTTLISRILKELKREDGWRVITIPETATDLISGFGIKPFDDCVSMEDFQFFVTEDQLHKEKMALKGAEMVPEENVLIVYDRAVIDNKAYITDEQFRLTLAHFGLTEDEVLARYDAVIHMVSCAKGAEFAFNYGNVARYETIDVAREKDDMVLRAWSRHPNLHIIDNDRDFENKINRAMAVVMTLVGQGAPQTEKRKYLIRMPDCSAIVKNYDAVTVDMMQSYLITASPMIERRVRQQRTDGGYLYFYTEKRVAEDGQRWVTERPISEKEYISYLMESDLSLHSVRKCKYRFTCQDRRMEIDVYPFSNDKAILFIYGPSSQYTAIPPEVSIIEEVTGLEEYKNRALANRQKL